MRERADPNEEAARRKDEWEKKNLDHAITFAVEALKTALLLNGGAAIALLTLVGALSVKDSVKVRFAIGPIKDALTWFGWGVGAVVVSLSLGYMSQIAFMEHVRASKDWNIYQANITRLLGIASLLGSVYFFYLGIWSALEGIQPNLQAEPQIPPALEAVCRSWSGLLFSQCK
jgi:hypothetical protein